MAFGRSKQPQSYGIPVRQSAPAPLPTEAPATSPIPYQAAPPPYSYASSASAPAASPYLHPAPPAAPWAVAAPHPAGFYAPVTQAAVNPYAPQAGSAPNSSYGQQQFVPPYLMTQPPQRSALRRAINSKPVAAVVIVLAVAGLGNAARNGGDQTKPLTMPASLNGEAPATNPAVVSRVSSLEGDLRAKNPRVAVAATAYVATGGHVTILTATRARIVEKNEIADAAASMTLDMASRRTFKNGIACYVASSPPAVACIREKRIAFVLISMGTNDLDAVSEIAQEAHSGLK